MSLISVCDYEGCSNNELNYSKKIYSVLDTDVLEELDLNRRGADICQDCVDKHNADETNETYLVEDIDDTDFIVSELKKK